MQRELWSVTRPILAEMLHNAMPVMERLDDPERAGMIAPEDARELITRAYGPVMERLADMPDVQAAFTRFAEDLTRAFNEAARSAGRLMADSADSGASSPTPEATPAPDAGRE